MTRNRLLASTFLALTLAASATAAAAQRWTRYQRPGTLNREQYFRMLDRNHDGWISQREYDGDYPFAWADRDRNGYLSWTEWRDSRVAARSARYGSQTYADRYPNSRYYDDRNVDSRRLSEFLRMDRNDDEFVTRSEWPGDYGSFARLDRNQDGAIHISEYVYD